MAKRGRHTSVEKSLRPTIKLLDSLSEITKIIFGRHDTCRHKFSPGHIHLPATGPSGKFIVLKAYSGRGVQMITLQTDSAEEAKKLAAKIAERYPQ